MPLKALRMNVDGDVCECPKRKCEGSCVTHKRMEGVFQIVTMRENS